MPLPANDWANCVLIQDYTMRWGMPLTGTCDSEITRWPTQSFLRTTLHSETFLGNPLHFPSPSQVPAWHYGQRSFWPSLPTLFIPHPHFLLVNLLVIQFHLEICFWRAQTNADSRCEGLRQEQAEVVGDHRGWPGRRVRSEEGGRAWGQVQSRGPSP